MYIHKYLEIQGIGVIFKIDCSRFDEKSGFDSAL
jgi:hypothetical protein